MKQPHSNIITPPHSSPNCNRSPNSSNRWITHSLWLSKKIPKLQQWKINKWSRLKKKTIERFKSASLCIQKLQSSKAPSEGVRKPENGKEESGARSRESYICDGVGRMRDFILIVVFARWWLKEEEEAIHMVVFLSVSKGITCHGYDGAKRHDKIRRKERRGAKRPWWRPGRHTCRWQWKLCGCRL